jgi:hypothetical protein
LYQQREKETKTNKMKNLTKIFLTENKELVINYYNEKVKGFYNISLKSFMLDLMSNFKKITTGDDLKKFDLIGNLNNSKGRLGMMDVEITTSFSTSYADSNHAKRVKYYGQEKVNQMSNI